METLVKSQERREASRPQSELLNEENVVHLGRLAIRANQRGINDPLTYLYEYLEKGSQALNGIRINVETDIAERLPKTPFVSKVEFNYSGDDFISYQDRISMREMTATNLDIFNQETAKNPELADEKARAESEAREVNKLLEWFVNAPIGACMVFESLPIGNQEFAVSRIYQKTDAGSLEGNFISLYNASVARFNKLRSRLSLDAPWGKTAAELLDQEYTLNDLESGEQLVDNYVKTYDSILEEETSEVHGFGLQLDHRDESVNGLAKVRSQPKLTAVYIDAIQAIAGGAGKANADLIRINNALNLGCRLELNQPLSIKLIKDVLQDIILGIASVIDRADEQLLKDLEHYQTSQEASLAAMSHFGSTAKATGNSYASLGCPEIGRSQTADSTSESGALDRAFGLLSTPNNFGKPKIGVCRINNCPSRGELSWWNNRTLVGGCDICVCCHKIFADGRSPQHTYDKQRKEAAEKKKREQDLRRMHTGK